MTKLSTSDESGVLVVLLEDASGMDNPNSDAFRSDLLQILQTNPAERLALDLSLLDTLSSSGIVALLTLKRSMEARRGRLVLYALQAPVFQVFKTLGLSDFFSIAPDRAAALADLALPKE
jgi:anti-sigma B factor antagonist